MKKITFILFTLIAGTAFGQNSANATATVNAEIVSPITISSSGVLNFGRIASRSTSGDVTLSPMNERSIPTEMMIPGNLVTSVPTFTVTKGEGVTYKVVTGSEDLSLTVGEGEDATTQTIIIKDITTSLESDNTQVSDSFTVGGTLTIAANQAPGNYEGEVSVTVSYE